MTSPTFADFFAGIGLAQAGLEAAGWRVLFANDIDDKKFQMYKDNFDDEDIYLVQDIRNLEASQIPDVTLWWGSFPCTDVSLAGYRRGLAGQQSGSLLAFLKLLGEKDERRPPLVALENVTGFLTSRKGQDFARTIRELNRLGYSCDAFVLDAIHFVPQSRPRLFVIGVHGYPETKSVGIALAERDEQLTSRQLKDFMAENRRLRWRILDIPPPPRGCGCLANVLQKLPSNSPRWWSEERVQYLLAQMSPRHRRVAESLRASGSLKYGTVYRRMRHGKSTAELRDDNVAGCLRTPRGGSSRQILLVAGKRSVRARFMTPREYARLMGAPDYKVRVADNQAYFGFGDAVCVPVVQWVGEHVLNPEIDRINAEVAEHVGAAV